MPWPPTRCRCSTLSQPSTVPWLGLYVRLFESAGWSPQVHLPQVDHSLTLSRQSAIALHDSKSSRPCFSLRWCWSRSTPFLRRIPGTPTSKPMPRLTGRAPFFVSPPEIYPDKADQDTFRQFSSSWSPCVPVLLCPWPAEAVLLEDFLTWSSAQMAAGRQFLTAWVCL